MKNEKQKNNKNPTTQTLPLPKWHKCYGCVWYPRNLDILYCPFQSCVRYKQGVSSSEEKDDAKTG